MKLHTQSVLASLLGMTAVLAGCRVGPDFKRPDPPAAERYTSQKLQVEPGSSANVDQQIALGASPDREWWRLFQSEALDAVVTSISYISAAVPEWLRVARGVIAASLPGCGRHHLRLALTAMVTASIFLPTSK